MMLEAAAQPGVDGIQGLTLPCCIGWLDEKLGKKGGASKRLRAVAAQLRDFGFRAVQYNLSNPEDYDRKVVRCCIAWGKRAFRLPVASSDQGAGASSPYGPHDLFGLTNGREKQAIVAAIKFETVAPPSELSSSAPPRYSVAVGGATTEDVLPGYGSATGLPITIAIYRSVGQKARGLTVPHIYLFDPTDGEFKCSVKDAHQMFEALIAAWGGAQSRISGLSAWSITADDDSWGYGEEGDEEEDEDGDRYVSVGHR